MFSELRKNDVVIEETQTKAQGTLEFKTGTPRPAFYFDAQGTSNHHGKRMLGVINLEVQENIFNATETKTKLKIVNTVF